MNNNWKKNTVIFLAGQSLSLFGTSLVQYAILWYITLNTQSGVMMTIYIICGFLPTFFLSPFAGVWADRYNRKLIIMLSDSIIALSTLFLAVLFLMGYDALWLLFLMGAVRATGSGVQTPAVGAFLPQIVPQEQLTRVNGIMGSIQAAVALVSPMVSGALLTVASIEAIFFIDVVTAAIAVLALLLFLQVPVHAKALEKQPLGYFSDMREGIIYIKNNAYIKQFFIFCTFFFFLIAPAAFLTPLQVARSFGSDVWRLTAIEITFSIGMIAGGLIMTAWGGFKNRVHTMTLSILVSGAGTVALGLVPVFWIYLAIMGAIGVTMPLFNTPSMVLIQEKVEESYMGRIFGVFSMIASSMMPLGMLVFGPVADSIKIEWLLVGTGALLFIQGFFLLGSRTMLEAGQPVEKPDR
ncbi:MFS transporter [Desulfoscipio gibsoniae]